MSSNDQTVSDSDTPSIHLSSSLSGIVHVVVVRGDATREGSYTYTRTFHCLLLT